MKLSELKKLSPDTPVTAIAKEGRHSFVVLCTTAAGALRGIQYRKECGYKLRWTLTLGHMRMAEGE